MPTLSSAIAHTTTAAATSPTVPGELFPSWLDDAVTAADEALGASEGVADIVAFVSVVGGVADVCEVEFATGVVTWFGTA